MSNKNKGFSIILAVILGIVCIIGIIGYNVAFTFNDTQYTVTVTDKERIVEGSGENTSSKYLVFCDDENGESLVFENTDELLRGKFNSSNIQGKLKEGNTYEITVVGYRVPFLSMYQNIIEVKEIETNE
jgi:hypothetical protein